MKYTNSVIINLPRQRVIELFDSSENLAKWQPGFVSYEHLSGDPGKEGAQAKMIYQMGSRTTEMIETITLNTMPDDFNSTYETKGVHNIQENKFRQKGPDVTEWTSISEFKFSTFPMKLIGWVMPGAFKKQTCKFMDSFKEYAESQGI